MDAREQYRRWLRHTDGELYAELKRIEGSESEIEDRFYRELSFGTGGLRGVIGAGSNRMNVFTVRKATQGLSDCLNAEYAAPRAAIAYDSRKNSEVFARAAAEVLAANGIRAHLFSEMKPTPMLSFAVRELECSAGIVITASHNPAQYNGYKVYGADGCQITSEAAEKITQYIRQTDVFGGVRRMPFSRAAEEKKICFIDPLTEARYFEETLKCSVFRETARAGLRVVYTPLNGTGNAPVRHILREIGVTDVSVVKEQERPDPAFATCPYPNPEIGEALAPGLRQMDETEADLLIATDPDCDRVGVAVRHRGKPVLLSGNQTGVLLFDFVCAMRTESGTMPARPFAVKTIVTTEMARAVAARYGVELADVLTGFKFIGEQIGLLERRGEAERYIFGFEESMGYLSGTYARDKDAVNASMLICEMAARCKTRGKTLVDALDELYAAYGYYFEQSDSLVCEGASGMDRMARIMENIRETPPRELCGVRVEAVCDFLTQKKYAGGETENLRLPPSDVIGLRLAGGSSVVVRPSGTEPKLKLYYSLRCADRPSGEALYRKIGEETRRVLEPRP